MSSLAQAITSFNVTGDFDIGELDAAIADLSSERANLGAAINTFDYTASANTVSSLNLSDARSRIADADIAQEMMAVNQERVITEMQLMMQQQEQDRIQEQNQIVAGVTGA